jgi:hypothetical protein
MKQISFDTKKLTLKVKTYLAVKILFWFMTIVMFFGPLIGVILSLADGNGFHVKYLFGLAFSYAIAYYVLKYALWNTWGKEIFEFNKNQIVYTIDYKLFKQKREFEKTEIVSFGYAPFGYVEDNKGRLYIRLKGESIDSAVTIPIPDLQPLISVLEASVRNGYKTLDERAVLS